MDVFEAIKTRRSLACDPAQPVEMALVEQVIAYGKMAPQHKRTAPWRFMVFDEANKDDLVQAWVAGGTEASMVQKKVNRAPVIVAVWCAVGRSEKTLPVWEEEAAVAAAIQNMLLAAHGLGLAGFWRSGEVCEMAPVQDLLVDGADKFDAGHGDRVMGMVYLGWPIALDKLS